MFAEYEASAGEMKQLFYKIIYSPFFNKVYRNVVKTLFPFVPFKLKIPVSGRIGLKFDTDKRMVLDSNQTSFVMRLLFWYGCDKFEYTPLFYHLIRHTKGYVDVGANVGYYDVMADKINPDCTVYAFEPSPGPYEYLKRNLAINECTHVKEYQLALSDTNGEISFFEFTNPKYTYLKHVLGGIGNIANTFADLPHQEIKVQSRTMDALAEEEGWPAVDLIKIDTEATEHIIMRGARETIAKHRPIIISEVLFDKVEDEIEAEIRRYDYRMFFFYKEHGLVEIDTLRRDGEDEARDVFCIPPEKMDLIKDFIAPPA